METKKIRNKVNVSADAQFIYEEVLMPVEKKMPSWEEALIMVDEIAAVPYISSMRKAKENLNRAEKAESRYRGTDTDIINQLSENLENMRSQWRDAEGDEKYKHLRQRAFELYDQYEKPYRTLNRRALESELENYIDSETEKGLLIHEQHFKKVYFDKQLGVSLLLFLYREPDQEYTQYWSLAGIMELKDYCEEDEDFGVYRADHLNPIINQQYKGDWVLKKRASERRDEILKSEIDDERYGTDYLAEVKGLLKSYNKNKALLTGKADSVKYAGLADKMDNLDQCIARLADDERRLITDYISTGSILSLARKRNYHKATMQYRLKVVIGQLELLYSERYE